MTDASGARKIHFIGVGGVAMATLAAMMKRRGAAVQGSDHGVYPPMSDFLASEHVAAFDGYDAAHVTSDIDLVVIGNAISRGNPELEETLQRKIRYCSLPEAVRDEFLWGARSIVIAGTHGKTTTTALTAWVLTHAGLDPSMLLGGLAANFGGGASYRLGGGRAFVIEGDEYDSAFFDKTAKFLKYLPDAAVVNNIEFDHVDIYPDIDAVRLAFRRFVNLLPRRGLLLLGADSPEAVALKDGAPCRTETFGLGDAADWRAHDVRLTPAGAVFNVSRRGELLGKVESPLMGEHNIRNVLAAAAVAAGEGVEFGVAADAICSFEGVKRRLELRGRVKGVAVYDDFAHHPTAVAATIAAVRAAHPGQRIWALFEPRSASSCRRVFQTDFAKALSGADEVVLPPVYRSTLPEAERLSVERLVGDLRAAGVHARHLPDVDAIVKTMAAETREGDIVLVMSNGGFGGIHQKLLAALDS